jgi:hypothetical protein
MLSKVGKRLPFLRQNIILQFNWTFKILQVFIKPKLNTEFNANY